jgi:NAD(P)-dependent dehydrogenase (short-subunit alcohol dehydrogenase family)
MLKRFISASENPEKAYQRILDTNPLGRIGSTLDVANVALFLVSDQASYLNGASIIVDGGYTASEPLGFGLS